MSQFMMGFAFIALTSMVVISGDFVLKLAADRGLSALSALVMVGIVLYTISALLWFGAMRHITLGQAGVTYSMLTLVALALIGAVVFGERLGFREITGISFAIGAMVLMMRPE